MRPPLLDKRSRADVLKEALTLAGRDAPPGWIGYTPDWTAPDDQPEPGHRLLQSFARLTELLIERLNQVPQTNFLSFLDFAGVERFPGAPAEVPVTFAVSKKAVTGGVVPASTRVATTQTKTADARVFETQRDFFASRAKIERIVAVQPAADEFTVLPPPVVPATAASLGAATPIQVLTDSEPVLRDVDHVLYIASESLFGRKDVVQLRVTFLMTGPFPADVIWRRFDKQAKTWVDLPAPSVNASVPGQVTFTFASFTAVDKVTVDGVEDLWIAVHFTGGVAAISPPSVVAAITGAVTPSALSGKLLDAAFYNGVKLDFSKPFTPFGERPAYADAFYMGSNIAFSPANQTVTLTFTIRPYVNAALVQQFQGAPAMSVTTRAKWQYLNVAGDWVDLAIFEHRFDVTPVGTTGDVTVTPVSVESPPPPGSAGEGTFIGTGSGDVICQVTLASFPASVGLHKVNGIESRWLRVLLVSENPYGKDGVVTGSLATTRFTGPLLIPPRIENLTISVVPRPTPIAITQIRTLNNFEFRAHSGATGALRPFVDLSAREVSGVFVFGAAPALYCGLDRPLEPEALISLFVDLAGPPSALVSPLEGGHPVIAWEYWSGSAGWRQLDATDQTLDLTTSGTVSFVAPRDAVPLALFVYTDPTLLPDVAPRWWLRARLESGSYDYPPAVRGIYLNTVIAENRSTFPEILIGSSNGEPDQTFPLVKGPVLGGHVWVRETERPTKDESDELDAEHAADRPASGGSSKEASPLNVVPVGDNSGEVWVRWRRVPNFRLSGPRSRHYLLDSVAAIVRFGNATRALIPVAGRNNLVFRDLQVGGGASANREAAPLAVKELKTSLPFIDKVFNVQAASAGASPWSIEQFEEFGPKSIKTRGRAVTREDYEWMIRQRFSDVARVRCLSVTEPGPGGSLQFKPGGVTALIVPWSTEPRPQPSQGLMRKVREFLTQTVLHNITSDVHVKGPDYEAVDIEATLVPMRPEFALVVAQKAQAALEAFLHPLTGGEDHKGYGFGRKVFLSEVQATLERIAEVDHVVSAAFSGAPGSDAFATTGNRLASSGAHQITVVPAED